MSSEAPKAVAKKAESSLDDSSSEDEKDVKKTVVYCLVNWVPRMKQSLKWSTNLNIELFDDIGGYCGFPASTTTTDADDKRLFA